MPIIITQSIPGPPGYQAVASTYPKRAPLGVVMVVKCPGSGYGDLLVQALDSECGNVKHGVAVQFEDQIGGFTMSLADLEKLVFLAKTWQGEK